jgi:hypothetical protein
VETPLDTPTGNVTKVLIAVHGIGDQTAYATAQAVALRLSAHRGRPIRTPLGRFYSDPTGKASSGGPRPQLIKELDGVVLAETYWAPIPRKVVNERYVLEDTKHWARSVAARVAYQDEAGQTKRQEKVDGLVVILDELIETIRILERLTFIADKAGVLKFDLAKLLVDFVGDVQLVADFQHYRTEILDKFAATVAESRKLVPKSNKPELYIIAHSEGTVITFLALLAALSDPAEHEWIHSVKGLMTIGSPIEIHHLLWPDLWRTPLNGEIRPSDAVSDVQIRWQNYMDYGDPIAYELTQTTEWLEQTGFAKHLKPTTHAFSRYPLPGKAHVDYWNDSEVFGHFFDNVVGLERPQSEKPRPAVTRSVNFLTRANGEVRGKLWMPTFTFVFPYALVATLLFLAVYVLDQSLAAALHQEFSLTSVVRDVVGVGALMFGITAAARLPRVSDSAAWSATGWATLAASMIVFALTTTPYVQQQMGTGFVQAAGLDPAACLAAGSGVSVGCSGGGIGLPTVGVAVAALLVAVLSYLSTAIFPRRGHYMLPALGVAAAVLIVGVIVETEFARTAALAAAKNVGDSVSVVQAGAAVTRSPSLWPLMLGSVAFFYLWWLSAMLFDLAFIWRRYARDGAIQTHLAKVT